jgi:SAM-dependent methyltransferase
LFGDKINRVVSCGCFGNTLLGTKNKSNHYIADWERGYFMPQKKKKIDWAEKRYREMLIEQRKFLWYPDTLDKLANWLKLFQGMTVVDVGCGLGYLGYTFWHYFGKKGQYFGLDQSDKLIAEAKKTSKQWVKQGKAFFVKGDAYKLPFPDNFADWVMCQTLLMHLEKPKLALAEMIRVAKPGGLIMCNEPDNLSVALASPYLSIPELKIEEQVLLKKTTLICHQGRIKLKKGDESIGNKVFLMMKELGLMDIDVRLNDRVYLLYPPYHDPIQQNFLKMAKKRFVDDHKFWMEQTKEEFLAGGGDLKEFARVRKIAEKVRLNVKKQMEKGEYATCHANSFYVVKGRKPK